MIEEHKTGSYDVITDSKSKQTKDKKRWLNSLAFRQAGGELTVWRDDAVAAGIEYDEVNDDKYSAGNLTGASHRRHASTRRGGKVVISPKTIEKLGGEAAVLDMLQSNR